ncbi:MAG: ROK family protein [Tetrasphaera sp.]
MVRSTPEVRQLNRERIRRQVQARKTCTKAEMSQWTSLSVSTCNTILNEMRADGEILYMAQEDGYVGRPATRFTYNPDYLHVLGVYVLGERGRNTVEFAVADALGQVRSRGRQHPESITYPVIEELIAEQLRADPLIRGIAFGFPGVAQGGVIDYCDVETLVGVDVAALVRARFTITPEVHNDMDFIATGVYNSVPHNGGNLATVLFPEDAYVGCGLIIDGQAVRGHTGFAGELYHILDGFGISRAAQRQALQDRAAFRDLAAKVVLIIGCTVDPEVVMLMGHNIDESDLAEVRKSCAAIVPEAHLPRLVASNDISEHYVSGLVRVGLDKLLFQLRE